MAMSVGLLPVIEMQGTFVDSWYSVVVEDRQPGINTKQVLLVLPGQRMPWKDGIMPCSRCLRVIWTFLHGLKKDLQQRKTAFLKRQLALFINRVVNSAFRMNVLCCPYCHYI